MALENHNTVPKISLESLLLLKREEKPSKEFWDNFDRDLRQKTLLALVHQEPWYAYYWQFIKMNLYAVISLSAATIFTFAFAIHHYGWFTFDDNKNSSIAEVSAAPSILEVKPTHIDSTALALAKNDPEKQSHAFFVIDIMPHKRVRRENFRKVMASQTFSLAPAYDNDPRFASDPFNNKSHSTFHSTPTNFVHE